VSCRHQLERDRRQRPKDLIKKLEDLRKEVADMAEDGDDEMSQAVAAGLDTLIAQAIAQAQRQ
jgi:uncharacterized protein (UPF0335 family)